MSVPGGEEAEKRSPGTPNGDVMTPSDEERERFEFLEMNFKYPLVNNRHIAPYPALLTD